MTDTIKKKFKIEKDVGTKLYTYNEICEVCKIKTLVDINGICKQCEEKE